MPQLTVYPTIDSYLNGSFPTLNYGSDAQMQLGAEYAGGSKTDFLRALGDFDVAAVPGGAQIDGAKLVRHIQGLSGPGGWAATVYRCTRPGQWLETEVSWDEYRSGMPWAARGGDYDQNVPTPKGFFEATAAGDHEIAGLEAFVGDALGQRGGVLSLLIKANDEAPGSDARSVWYSRDYTTDQSKRWRLVIDYTPANPAGRTPEASPPTAAQAHQPGRPVAPAIARPAGVGARPRRPRRGVS